MADFLTTFASVLTLLGTASFMVVIALVAFNFIPFRPLAEKKKIVAKIAAGIVFGLLAIYGTLMGTKLEDGTIINVRELAAMIAGVVGGPVGGAIAGLIGGLHRYTVGGATGLPCTVSTVLIGLISGVVASKLTGRAYLLKGATLGFVLETGAMGLILLLVQPLATALSIVDKIAIPMITANTVGLVLWLLLFSRWKMMR